MTQLLALETSNEVCSVVLETEDGSLSFFRHAPMQHAELLLPAIRDLLSQAGLELRDLNAIAFGRGPGSFTSLRIGVGVVQGLAWASGVGVVPVSSLAAVAQQALETHPSPVNRICVAIDARMQEVYTASFSTERAVVRQTGAEWVGPPGNADFDSLRPFIAAGNGFARFDALAEFAHGADACYPELWPRAESVARLARDWLKDHDPLPAAHARPVYVRNEVASKPES